MVHNTAVQVTSPPPITHILETCLMVKDLDASVEFYKDVFNVEPFLKSPRLAGFSFSQTTLLLFQLGLTASDTPMPDNRGTIPGHGPTSDILDILVPDKNPDVSSSSGTTQTKTVSNSGLNQHFCFAVPSPNDVGLWENWFEEKNVKILGKVDWERGGRSVYFADLDGNVGEVGSRGIWAHY
ncbi:uncharacterized protein Z518_10876 [Rhinocladiella mackenziei CBS 650.93]|uniref:VOC domain-containing protein n=1 Tax=Rhinocladiella mackenziei CBS 650.93 TaxID=1442369 RepID=A0A0D2I2I1_9EURO|nr:uncharacterized protein Z518_10876 [Rhinocladiella mackenziei CBS 650.93]KIW99948.1 hypothetical protein Z518_10876 [Rhinocladiella mackenziei CBS 650.93]